MTLITILGSCRQESLYRLFPVTTIRDNLNYPHYTKEIIQTAEFCKGVSTIPLELTRWLFRVGLLEKSTITPTSFTDQYNKTDMFVVEISSRIAYRYQGFFAHHIITESPYGFHDRQNIQQYDLTDQEIENDIVYLKDLLNPKPLLIVSHIYTRKAGKRYELVQVLKDICTRHSIPFFDPSDYLGDTVGVYVNEPVLAHFTQKGHDLVGKKYVELISLLAN